MVSLSEFASLAVFPVYFRAVYVRVGHRGSAQSWIDDSFEYVRSMATSCSACVHFGVRFCVSLSSNTSARDVFHSLSLSLSLGWRPERERERRAFDCSVRSYRFGGSDWRGVEAFSKSRLPRVFGIDLMRERGVARLFPAESMNTRPLDSDMRGF